MNNSRFGRSRWSVKAVEYRSQEFPSSETKRSGPNNMFSNWQHIICRTDANIITIICIRPQHAIPSRWRPSNFGSDCQLDTTAERCPELALLASFASSFASRAHYYITRYNSKMRIIVYLLLSGECIVEEKVLICVCTLEHPLDAV